MTTAAPAKPKALTPAEIARRFGVETWMIGRLCDRKLLDEPQRLGRYRLVFETDLPMIERALRAGGYLPAKEAV